jgi:Protein of unknown function (DUF3040)
MREHERRELHVIEQNLLAEAPELAEQFASLAEYRRSGRGRRTVRWLAAILLLLGVVLWEVSLLLGALVLAGVSVVRWSAQAVGTDELDRRCR